MSHGLTVGSLAQILVDITNGLVFCHGGCGGVFEGVVLHRDIKVRWVRHGEDREEQARAWVMILTEVGASSCKGNLKGGEA